MGKSILVEGMGVCKGTEVQKLSEEGKIFWGD